MKLAVGNINDMIIRQHMYKQKEQIQCCFFFVFEN